MRFGIQQVYTIWYVDLQELIKEVYGKDVDIQQGELGNGSYTEFEAKKSTGLEWFNSQEELVTIEEAIQEWVDNDEVGEYSDLELIGPDLANRDIIPEGKYIVTVWW